MAQTMRPDGIYIFYMARILNIHIFPIFNKKSEKYSTPNGNFEEL